MTQTFLPLLSSSRSASPAYRRRYHLEALLHAEHLSQRGAVVTENEAIRLATMLLASANPLTELEQSTALKLLRDHEFSPLGYRAFVDALTPAAEGLFERRRNAARLALELAYQALENDGVISSDELEAIVLVLTREGELSADERRSAQIIASQFPFESRAILADFKRQISAVDEQAFPEATLLSLGRAS
jgi:hypothetical protein